MTGIDLAIPLVLDAHLLAALNGFLLGELVIGRALYIPGRNPRLNERLDDRLLADKKNLVIRRLKLLKVALDGGCGKIGCVYLEEGLGARHV